MFTEENKPLLEEAASIDFKFGKDGRINSARHTKHELGIYFIKQAVEIHGNRYSYSKVEYRKALDKVIIMCKAHGAFLQSPNNHLKGKGCPKCAGSHSPTTEEFIMRAREVHTDKYDYSSSHYVSNKDKITIICPTHGEFKQTPGHHLQGQGCPRCAGNLTLSSEEFIRRAREVHADKYDYSLSHYVSSKEKITIICHMHGEFKQSPSHHLQGKGCIKCAGKYSPITEEFVAKARGVHGPFYLYDKTIYVNAKTKVEISCPIHGEFLQTPDGHLHGHGCPKCAGNAKVTTAEFIRRASIAHNDLYSYENVQYRGMSEKVEIICPEHGMFLQTPGHHLNFRGCPKCAGKNHNILYLLKCLVTGWYKIGITTDNIQKRLLSIGGELEEIHHVVLEDPRKHESILHNLYNDFNVYHDGVRNGNTEFFSLIEEQVQEVIDYMNEVSSA